MNREKVKQLLNTLKAAIEAFQPELDREIDPFVVLIYQSRSGYRHQADRKSGKRAQQYAHYTYQRAVELGFRGSPGAWLQILQAVPPAGTDANKHS